MKKMIKFISYLLIIIVAIIIISYIIEKVIVYKSNFTIIDGETYDVRTSNLILYPKTDEFIAKMPCFMNLKELTISPYKNSFVIIASTNKQQITDYIDKYTDANDLSILSLVQFNEIEYLDISGTEVDNLQFIVNMTKLKKLYANNTKISTIGPIAQCSEIRMLDIQNNILISDITELKQCSKIETVLLSNTSVTDYSVLFELPELKSISISKGSLSNTEINKLIEKGVEINEIN